MLKIKHILIAALSVATLALSACGDDEPKSSGHKTEQGGGNGSSVSMAGKTITCNVNEQTSTFRSNWTSTISFTATTYEMKIHSVVDSYDAIANKWVNDVDLNLSEHGTYSASSSQITLTDDNGHVTILTKSGSGWKNPDGRIYK